MSFSHKMPFNTDFVVCLIITVCSFSHPSVVATNCDEAPDHNDGIDCCNTPRLVNKAYHEECATAVGGLSTSGFNITRECIMTECIFNKYGVIKTGDHIDVSEIKASVKGKLESYPEWETIFNAAVDKCVTEGTAKGDKLRKEHNGLKNCNPKYAYIVACIGIHLMVECPQSDRGGDAAKCDNLRTYFKDCPEQFPPKFTQ